MPTPRPTLRAALLLVAGGGELFVGDWDAEDVVEVVVVASDEVVVVVTDELVVDDVFEVEETVLLLLGIVVKGFKSPEMVKTPSPVWQLQFAILSLSQQKLPWPQLRTPASERLLYKPAVALSI
jgi:hypothetical protein